MISPSSLQRLLLALAAVLGLCARVLAVCKSDGGYACPAQDDIAPVVGAYDPATVDWNAVVADVYAITDSEPRVCTMAIRTWFHDAGSHEPLDNGPASDEEMFPGIGGSDASILTHKDETLEHENAFHGFAQVAKHVLVQVRGLCTFRSVINGVKVYELVQSSFFQCWRGAVFSSTA